MARISKTDREEVLNTTRQRLLDAAAMEFADKGFSGANINTISLNAGFSKGTIYNYFASKQALILALIADAGALHLQTITEQIQVLSNPKQRLFCFFEAGFRFVEVHPARARFLLNTLYNPDTDLQAAIFRAYQPMFYLLVEQILVPGIAQGIFREVDKLSSADLLMTLYLGTASHVNQQGKVYMDPRQVADFAFHALQRADQRESDGG
jgi:AcrR family transcriptional regulator